MKQRSAKNMFGENYMNYKIGIYPFYDIAGNEIIGYYCKKTIRNNKGWKIFVNEKYTYGQFWLTVDVFNIGCSNNSKYVEFVKNPIKEAYKFMEWDYDTEKRA
jgi:hypothetical protein